MSQSVALLLEELIVSSSNSYSLPITLRRATHLATPSENSTEDTQAAVYLVRLLPHPGTGYRLIPFPRTLRYATYLATQPPTPPL